MKKSWHVHVLLSPALDKQLTSYKYFSSDLGGLLQHLIDYCYYGKLLKNFWINIYQ